MKKNSNSLAVLTDDQRALIPENISEKEYIRRRAIAIKYLDTFSGTAKIEKEVKEQFVDNCCELGLSPVKKEIFLGEFKGSYTPLVGYRAYLKAAESSGDYGGFHYTIKKDRDKIMVAIEVYRTSWYNIQGKPFVHYVKESDVAKNNSFWRGNKIFMLVKTAISQAFRLVFYETCGVLPYSQEELELNEHVTVITPTNKDGISKKDEGRIVSEEDLENSLKNAEDGIIEDSEEEIKEKEGKDTTDEKKTAEKSKKHKAKKKKPKPEPVVEESPIPEDEESVEKVKRIAEFDLTPIKKKTFPIWAKEVDCLELRQYVISGFNFLNEEYGVQESTINSFLKRSSSVTLDDILDETKLISKKELLVIFKIIVKTKKKFEQQKEK